MPQRQWIFLASTLVISCLIAVIGYVGYLWNVSKKPEMLIIFATAFGALLIFQFLRRQLASEKEEILKEQTRLKRTLEEYHLITEKNEFDSNHSKELVRRMKKEVQKKNSTLLELAKILSESMEKQISCLIEDNPDLDVVLQRSYVMQKFSVDLETLAQLNFPTEMIENPTEKFDVKLQTCIDKFESQNSGTGKFFNIKTEEEQILIRKNEHHLSSLMMHLLDTVFRLNVSEFIEINLITYIDAELGNSVRVSINFTQIPGYKSNATEFFSQYQKVKDVAGKDISPGLAPVIINVLTGYLGGHITYSVDEDSQAAMVLVLPLSEKYESEN